ncbi:ornithine carbamoyltransferase [Candidatus Woesearchaeota archaeon]|jgi:ornithine carbamoyltransferase|nr:ornithine carbamoyltransferase [Candidatus Woesearchaeota archaeon]
MKEDLLDLRNLTKNKIKELIDLALDIKQNPEKYNSKLNKKTLLMIFEKPSLRTRVSFETGMTQMGGHAIYYDLSTSPMGKKECIADTAKTASRYVEIIMARLFKHENITQLAKNSSIPIINALTNFSHPCQILSDLLTITEKKCQLNGLKLTYLGDANNNVTHSLLFGCAAAGINITVSCPSEEGFSPLPEVLDKSKNMAQITGSTIEVNNDPKQAVKNADIIYTDSWMSYHIKDEEKEKRFKILIPYQVNNELLQLAKEDVIFMNCLPAMRGMEQTAEVIDGLQSVVFDQAENRLHMQKAIILNLLKIK